MQLIFLGPPGAGKGTQAAKLAEAEAIPHISTGDMLRESIQAGSDLGQRVKGVLDAGELVSDDLMLELVRERLSQADCVAGYILDGFPRTLPQAEMLETLLREVGMTLSVVLQLVVPNDTLMQRIAGRSEGRSDDSAAVAARRLEVYAEQTAPLVSYYRSRDLLVDVDGLGTVEEVHRRVLSSVRQ